MEATEHRRSNYLHGCSRLEARAGGSGSRHLEPPLSPPFLSRSPPPPEMAEPRPGSHTPCPRSGWLPGRVEKSHKCRGSLSFSGSQTTIVEAAILRPSCFPTQHLVQPPIAEPQRSYVIKECQRLAERVQATGGCSGFRAVRLVRFSTSLLSPPLLFRLRRPPWEPPS